MGLIWPYEKFEEMLRRETADVVAKKLFEERNAFVFRNEVEKYSVLRSRIAEPLSVTPESVRIIGSALTGFSLSPDNFGRAFSDASDVDVVVVSETLFDSAWSTILRWHYPRRGGHLDAVDKDWMSQRRREIYWGWFVPTQIRYPNLLSRPKVLTPLRDLSRLWFDTFNGLGNYSEFADRKINGRLYRTWGHVHLYHANGLNQIKYALPRKST